MTWTRYIIGLVALSAATSLYVNWHNNYAWLASGAITGVALTILGVRAPWVKNED